MRGVERMYNKKIYSFGLAKELLKRGNKIIDIEMDRQRKHIYIFEYSPKLEKDFIKIKNAFDNSIK